MNKNIDSMYSAIGRGRPASAVHRSVPSALVEGSQLFASSVVCPLPRSIPNMKRSFDYMCRSVILTNLYVYKGYII